jgi:hypothetical protein
MTINAKQRSKGKIAIFKKMLKSVFHCSDAEIISFKMRSIISPTTTSILYEVKLEFVIILGAMIIRIPQDNKYSK